MPEYNTVLEGTPAKVVVDDQGVKVISRDAGTWELTSDLVPKRYGNGSVVMAWTVEGDKRSGAILTGMSIAKPMSSDEVDRTLLEADVALAAIEAVSSQDPSFKAIQAKIPDARKFLGISGRSVTTV